VHRQDFWERPVRSGDRENATIRLPSTIGCYRARPEAGREADDGRLTASSFAPTHPPLFMAAHWGGRHGDGNHNGGEGGGREKGRGERRGMRGQHTRTRPTGAWESSTVRWRLHLERERSDIRGSMFVLDARRSHTRDRRELRLFPC
jgi:hypothetical protein